MPIPRIDNEKPVSGGTLPEVAIHGNSSAPNVANSSAGFQPFAAGILSLLGNVYSSYTQHKHQIEYMDKAQRQAIERWNMENEYNLPSNVKKRLIEAGLNPNLMYGSSGSSGGVAGSMSGGSSPEAFSQNPFEGVLSAISAAKENRLRLKQMENEVRESAANADMAEVRVRDAKKESAARDSDIELPTVYNYRLVKENGTYRLKPVGNDSVFANYYNVKAQHEVSEYYYGSQKNYDDAVLKSNERVRDVYKMKSFLEESDINIQLLREQLRHIQEDNKLSEQEKRNAITAQLKDVLDGLVAAGHLTLNPKTGFYTLNTGYDIYANGRDIVLDILKALGLGVSLFR